MFSHDALKLRLLFFRGSLVNGDNDVNLFIQHAHEFSVLVVNDGVVSGLSNLIEICAVAKKNDRFIITSFF